MKKFKYDYSWGHGYTDLFLLLEGQTPKILDVESATAMNSTQCVEAERLT